MEKCESQDAGSLEAMTQAVILVVADVLRAPSITAHEDFKVLRMEMREALRVATLLNQWLGANLTVQRLLRERTPVRLAAALLRGGVAPPEPADAKSPTVAGSEGVMDGKSEYWKNFWEATYRFSTHEEDDSLDTAGWLDKGTLSALPRSHMKEWVDSTVARVRSLRHESVLDVGCGVGLILFPLAPECERYVGVDFSEEAVGRVHRRVGSSFRYASVEVLKAEAHQAAEMVNGRFDLILLNSVVQYFPDLQYLKELLGDLVGMSLRPDGSVFIGDVRNRDLNEALHTSLVAENLPDSTPAVQANRLVDRSLAVDSPLLLSPGDLKSLIDGMGIDGKCYVQVRRGNYPTEMNRFRYDALIVPGARSIDVEVREFHWMKDSVSGGVEEFIAALLRSAADSLVIRSAPDARTYATSQLAAALRDAASGATVGELRNAISQHPVVDPEQVWQLGHRRGFGVAVAPGREAGCVDMAFLRDGDDWAAAELLG